MALAKRIKTLDEKINDGEIRYALYRELAEIYTLSPDEIKI